MLMNPKKAERNPWELFFIGLFYGSVAFLLTHWVFSDGVFAKYSSIFLITLTVILCMPFIYYTIKLEEKKVNAREEGLPLLKEHWKAIQLFLWLFLGLVIAFSFFNIVMPSSNNFSAQIETYCSINNPANYQSCLDQYIPKEVKITGLASSDQERFIAIFTNNMYVLIFTLVFSLVLGAGSIIILAWNASVIAAAIGIFAKSEISQLPLGVGRYMIHGIPEIAAYFIVALAGGLVSVAVIRHEYGTEKFWEVLQDSLNLVIAAIIVLVIAALVEVFVTPVLF